MKKLLIASLLVFILLPCQGRAQHPFKLSIDIAAFRYDDEQSYVELYYAFPRASLSYAKEPEGYRSSAVIHAQIKDIQADHDPIFRIWRVPIIVADTTDLNSNMLIGKINLTLIPGKYTFLLIARDEADPSVVDSVVIQYEIKQFPNRSVNFSDIELCSSIQQIEADSLNIFYKNTLEVIPNPSLMYGNTFPTLLYYAELYNTDLEQYLIKTDIISSYGKTMLTRSQKKSGKYSSRVEVNSMYIGSLASGIYTLILSFGDTSGTVLASQSKVFYVYNPDIPIDSAQVKTVAAKIALEFAAMAEDELDVQFDMAQYISTKEERTIWGSLKGAEPKKKFLTRFWADRDPDITTTRNEFYEEYMRRITLCNEQFRTSYRPGWKTDRGRVYILYGAPDYIERFSSTSDTKPYEIWTFDNIQGGVDFIFVDKGGFNEYILVHSTMNNEINNPDWQRHIRTY